MGVLPRVGDRFILQRVRLAIKQILIVGIVDRDLCGNKEGASKYPVATLTIQKRRTQRVDLPRGPRRRKGTRGLGLERDAKI